MKRIGIFGGTFDPPHNGHIAIAEQAKKQLGLECVWFIPAYIPPHKHQHSSTSAQRRLKMIKLAIGGRKNFKISAIELKRRGISYTIDTLKAFKRRFPKAELVLIIGADNLVQFNTWKSPRTILQLASLAVYKRKGFSLSSKRNANDFILLKGQMLQVSSTEIRNRIEKGLPIQALVPNQINLYIKRHSLYRMPTHIPLKRQLHEKHRVC